MYCLGVRNSWRQKALCVVFLVFVMGGCSLFTPPKPSKPTPLPPIAVDLPDPYNCPADTVLDISDQEIFYSALIVQLKKSFGDPITCGDMQSLSSFYGDSGRTFDLTGIEYAINLTSIFLANVRVKSLLPLKNLSNLSSISIGIDTFMLRKLDCNEGQERNTEGLEVLTNLPNLKWLALQDSGIKDLSFLSQLSQLESLNLRCNRIEDLSPLTNLTQLERLILGGNNITDLSPLESLTKLRLLMLDRTCPETLEPLADLVNLQTLSIKGRTTNPRYCPLENFQPIANLKNLEFLDIVNTNFSDLPLLLNYPKLKKLDLAQNNITDLTPLADLLAKGVLTSDPGGSLSIDLRGNNLKDVNGFAEKLVTLEPDSYHLSLGANCFEAIPEGTFATLKAKGVAVAIWFDQKPECFMRVIFLTQAKPIFYWPD